MTTFFSKNILYLRKKKKIAQAELADKIGVNQATIARWETEKMSPSVQYVEEIANALGISIADLLGTDMQASEEKPPQIIKIKDDITISLGHNETLSPKEIKALTETINQYITEKKK